MSVALEQTVQTVAPAKAGTPAARRKARAPLAAAATAAATAASLADGGTDEWRRTTCYRTVPSLWLTSAVEGGKQYVAGERAERAGVRRNICAFIAFLPASARPRLLAALRVSIDM